MDIHLSMPCSCFMDIHFELFFKVNGCFGANITEDMLMLSFLIHDYGFTYSRSADFETSSCK